MFNTDDIHTVQKLTNDVISAVKDIDCGFHVSTSTGSGGYTYLTFFVNNEFEQAKEDALSVLAEVLGPLTNKNRANTTTIFKAPESCSDSLTVEVFVKQLHISGVPL